MRAEEVSDFLLDHGIQTVSAFVNDREYSLPSREYLRDAFAVDYRKYMESWGLRAYSAERNDCDNFVLNAMTYAANLHARTSGKATGLAFGGFYYYSARLGAHAINFAIVNENGLGLVFYEPQNALTGVEPEIRLTQGEMGSCFGYVLLG